MGGSWCRKQKASKRFFFEKKKQKTSAKLDRAGETAWSPV
jgi:hypothetical protein